MNNQRYDLRGVSASKEDVHNAIKNVDKGLYPKAFCKIIPDILGGDPEYCNIMHADGAGTKSSLAYLYWKETGDMSVWKGIAQDALIMNIDDLLCVGATDNILLSSTIGRNKLLIPGEVISAIINGTEELLQELRQVGVNIISTGGETADVGDLVRTIIVDSTVTCRMKRSHVINNANIAGGDVIVGLASFGQATYEKEYNGGMGSNGLTSARHDVFAKYLAEKYPEVDFVYPMHLNPNVRKPIHEVFGEDLTRPNFFFIEPLQYLEFVHLMSKATIVLTDSGGIQEEAPGLGKPVLVMRDTTERPEALESGTVHLVGTDYDKIMNEVSTLLEDAEAYAKMSQAVNPYGDGLACGRIVKVFVEDVL